jgi:hypothetical protein
MILSVCCRGRKDVSRTLEVRRPRSQPLQKNLRPQARSLRAALFQRSGTYHSTIFIDPDVAASSQRLRRSGLGNTKLHFNDNGLSKLQFS